MNYIVCTIYVLIHFRFEWDPIKAISNLNKHKVSFEEAKSAFYDDLARLIDDLDHSADEERFILLGKQRAKNQKLMRGDLCVKNMIFLRPAKIHMPRS